MHDLDISPLDSAEVPALRELLAKIPCKPLDFWEAADPDQQNSYWFEDIQASLSGPDCAALAARSGGSIVGFLLWSLQPWETRVIGNTFAVIKYLAVPPDAPRAIGDALVARMCEDASSRGVECVTAKLHGMETSAIHSIERNGFCLMDTVLDFTFDYRRMPLDQVRPPPLAAGVQIGLATAADADGLIEVAGKAFGGHFGRFHADRRIGKEKAKTIYEEWMRSSLGGWVDFIVVCKCDGRVAGYSMWKKPSARESGHGFLLGHYSIAGVHPDYFGRGLFSALTYEGMRRLPELGRVDRIEGPTHVNNYPVQRGYLKLGWRITGARHTFHRWLADQA
jgi:ribosomal protein S18 acetylase RimI-like enzyme